MELVTFSWRNAFIFEQIAKTSFVYQLLRISGEHIRRLFTFNR